MNRLLIEKAAKGDAELQAEVERLIRQHEQTLVQMGTKKEQKRLLAISKTDGKNSKEKESAFRDKTYEFFKIRHGIDLKGYFNPRPDIMYCSNLRFEQESLIIYGVDFMSPKKLFNYFRYFQPRSIDWINDSTCKITFKFCSGAKRAVIENISANWGRINRLQRGMWYPLNPYLTLGFQRQLQARIATNLDLTTQVLQQSKYSLFQKALQQYNQQIQKFDPLNSIQENRKQSIFKKRPIATSIIKPRQYQEPINEESIPISSIPQQIQKFDSDELSLLDCIRCLQIGSSKNTSVDSVFQI